MNCKKDDNVLFVNGCNREKSRTRRLALALLSKLCEEYEELRLPEVAFPVADEAFICHRDELIDKELFDDPLFDMARQFAKADVIVIAVPFWDLSFPASFKQYLE